MIIETNEGGALIIIKQFLEGISVYFSKNITYLGFIERDQLPIYYSLSDIFVLPTHYDPWGAVINEAMACNSPVISTNMACASYELIKNGYNGFIVKAGDVKQLKDKIEFLLNKKRIEEFGMNSYKIIKNFDHKIVALK
jgi:glycosyltransferase involved in cell wall biosynthesis